LKTAIDKVHTKNKNKTKQKSLLNFKVCQGLKSRHDAAWPMASPVLSIFALKYLNLSAIAIATTAG